MDLMHLPLPWYYVDSSNVSGVHFLGICGLIACIFACVACWIKATRESDA